MQLSGVLQAIPAWIPRVLGWRGLERWVRRYPLGAAGLAAIVIVVVMTGVGFLVTPFDPREVDATNRWGLPSSEHWLGTDHFGRDVLSRLLVGGRVSLAVGTISVLVGTVAGGLLGSIGGYKGGLIDNIIQRPVDCLIAIPSLILALGVVTALGPSMWTVTTAISITMVPRSARVVRSAALQVRATDYILAARAIGCSDMRMICRHIIPNVIAPFLIIISISIGGAIVTESTLSFLGVGIPPGTPSWGMMLNRALAGLRLNPWVAIVPGAVISLVVFGFNLFGDALRDSLDPRLRQ